MGPRPPYTMFKSQGARVHKTTYAPVIYTAQCIMFWMRAYRYPLLGEVGGGWALEFPSSLGPKWQCCGTVTIFYGSGSDF
jgi:hypothetical protein